MAKVQPIAPPEGVKQYYPLHELKNWEGNYNNGDVGGIYSSIKRFGFNRSISVWVDSEGTPIIIAGNHTMLALRWLQRDKITVKGTGVFVDESGTWFVQCSDSSHLSFAEAKAYAIADNRWAAMASQDDALLLKYLQEIKDTGDEDLQQAVGYTDDDLAWLEEVVAGGGEGAGSAGSDSASHAGNMQQKFLVPPFSVLDARQGYWQDRKRQWIELGIRGELGRTSEKAVPSGGGDNENLYATYGAAWRGQEVEEDYTARGTSIFDPVLAEIMFKWFTPTGGTMPKVLDPFAGEATKGIVAALSHMAYTGVELRQGQVDTNREMYLEVAEAAGVAKELVPIKVSAASARLLFEGCTVDYITSTCKGRCCSNPRAKHGISIPTLPNERARLQALGGDIDEDGMLKADPVTKRCKFQSEDGLCSLHLGGDKPYVCWLSPFTINDNDTLVIKNRNKMLNCFKDKSVAKTPAYVAYIKSLEIMFGEAEARRIYDHLEAGGDDITAYMPRKNYDYIMAIRAEHRRDVLGRTDERAGYAAPQWIQGDSAKLLEYLPEGELYDFVFTSPPYFDLEIYTDSGQEEAEADGSAFNSYPQFIAWYKEIFAQAVSRLADNRFLVVKVGEVRDRKTGAYYNFVGDNIRVFTELGLHYYNEIVLITAVGTLPLRAGKSFNASRKVGKGHQNILVFYKGDLKAIGANFGELQLPDIEDSNESDTGESDN